MVGFTGQVVVVTGAARGQGAAEAKRFAAAGARVEVADVLEEDGFATVTTIRELGGDAAFHRLDVTQESDWEALASELSSQGRGVNVLVNNAGIVKGDRSLLQSSISDWESVMNVNLYGPLLGLRHIAPLIRDSGGGAIVNTGSSAALTGHLSASYAASKWALRGLTKTAAIEFQPWNIRVNSVHPGLVHTPIVAGATAFVSALERDTPLGRGAEPEEIAAAVVWMASPEASFVTGVDLAVDGGLTDLAPFHGMVKELEV